MNHENGIENGNLELMNKILQGLIIDIGNKN
jgi:hypothetical protein